MPILSQDNFIASCRAQNRTMHDLLYRAGIGDHPCQINPSIQLVGDAQQKIRTWILGGGKMHKSYRPWDLLPTVFDSLDRREVWMGWEFETGWQTREAYGKACAHAYDNYDGCMFDSEGEGMHAVEITFTPSELSKFRNGTAPAYQFVQWMEANPGLVYRGDDQNVGTHVNLSDPRFAEGYDTVNELCKFLNRSLDFTIRLTKAQRNKMWGRDAMYAGFFHNSSGQGAAQNNWLECKAFRTAYNVAAFEDYIKVGEAFVKAIDVFFRHRDRARNKGISNLYDVAFHGAEPLWSDWTPTIITDRAHHKLYTRMGAAHGDRVGCIV